MLVVGDDCFLGMVLIVLFSFFLCDLMFGLVCVRAVYMMLLLLVVSAFALVVIIVHWFVCVL